MYNKTAHAFCQEFYTLVKSIEVAVRLQGEARYVRIDSFKNEHTGKYSTSAYLSESVTLQPTYPQTNGKFDQPPQEFKVWVDYDLPWVDANTEDDALRQALGFLGERVSK